MDRENVDYIVTVSEDGIIRAMRTIWERMKSIAEPSTAVTLGALLEEKVKAREKKVGNILSGSKVDPDSLSCKIGNQSLSEKYLNEQYML
ncbi:MAG: hypothetical protein R6V01_08285 [Thermoplasmatota archaeon]